MILAPSGRAGAAGPGGAGVVTRVPVYWQGPPSGPGSHSPGLQEEGLAGRGEQLTAGSASGWPHSGWPEQTAPHRDTVPENLTLQAAPPEGQSPERAPKL